MEPSEVVSRVPAQILANFESGDGSQILCNSEPANDLGQPAPKMARTGVMHESSLLHNFERSHTVERARDGLIVKKGELGQRLEAAKPVVYRAGGLLPQFPWKAPRSGVVLVIDL